MFKHRILLMMGIGIALIACGFMIGYSIDRPIQLSNAHVTHHSYVHTGSFTSHGTLQVSGLVIRFTLPVAVPGQPLPLAELIIVDDPNLKVSIGGVLMPLRPDNFEIASDRGLHLIHCGEQILRFTVLRVVDQQALSTVHLGDSVTITAEFGEQSNGDSVGSTIWGSSESFSSFVCRITTIKLISK